MVGFLIVVVCVLKSCKKDALLWELIIFFYQVFFKGSRFILPPTKIFPDILDRKMSSSFERFNTGRFAKIKQNILIKITIKLWLYNYFSRLSIGLARLLTTAAGLPRSCCRSRTTAASTRWPSNASASASWTHGGPRRTYPFVKNSSSSIQPVTYIDCRKR